MPFKRTVRKTLMRRHVAQWTLLLLLSGALSPLAAEPLNIAGWIEWAQIYPDGPTLRAKLDTGARHSSIHAEDVQVVEDEQGTWVTFDIVSRQGKLHPQKRPLIRYSTVKRHFGKKQQRPVISLPICIGNQVKEVEVNLVDRTGLNYALLIGRSYLKETYLIDSSQVDRTTPNCASGSEL